MWCDVMSLWCDVMSLWCDVMSLWCDVMWCDVIVMSLWCDAVLCCVCSDVEGSHSAGDWHEPWHVCTEDWDSHQHRDLSSTPVRCTPVRCTPVRCTPVLPTWTTCYLATLLCIWVVWWGQRINVDTNDKKHFTLCTGAYPGEYKGIYPPPQKKKF